MHLNHFLIVIAIVAVGLMWTWLCFGWYLFLQDSPSSDTGALAADAGLRVVVVALWGVGAAACMIAILRVARSLRH